MNDNNSTDGLPSSDLFDLTAPNNEYLTDIQTTITTETRFFTIEVSSLIDIHPNYEELDLSNEIEEAKVHDEVKIEKTENFTEYVSSDEITIHFSELLEHFLTKYFKISAFSPLVCEMLMFIFPGEEYIEPMIKIVYPNSDDFDNIKIRDDIEEKFNHFLVNNSENLEEYRAFRKIQKKFRFVIQRE